jgi:SMI1 / KNR4 family (SUKH-1)
MEKKFCWTTEYYEADIVDIQTVEQNISNIFAQDYPEGFMFPLDYIDFIHIYQGGKPSCNYIDIEGYRTTAFDCFLTFIMADDNDILEQYHVVRKRLGISLLFPIAWNANLNYFCFDYRNNRKKPTIVYWDRKALSGRDNFDALFYVCGTLTELINKFHE